MAAVFIVTILLISAIAYASPLISISVDGQKITSDVAPQLIQDRTLVPLRAIAESFGAEVKWLQDIQTVEIITPYQKFMDNYSDKGMYIMQAADLLPMVNAGTAVVLDVRSASLRNEGYINGSLHIPMPELLQRIDELPTEKTVVVYCSDNINASYAVAILSMKGYDAFLLENGIDAWMVAGGETTWPPCPSET
jgi:rhodanese-related sulfurtransferase